MKKYFFIFFVSFISLYSEEINILNIPQTCFPGSVMLLIEETPKYFNRQLIDLKLDNVSRLDLLLDKKSTYIKIKLPLDLGEGKHQLEVDLDDQIFGNVNFEIIYQDSIPSDINGLDPDPETQNGKPKNLGANPQPIKRPSETFNPSGGYLNTPYDCSKLHIIDGEFTDIDSLNYSEWHAIIPLKGQFSNLYLDYCSNTGTLYVMNDWVLGNGNYDTATCYNLFEFMTNNGAEHWYVKVYNSSARGVEVTLNGIDVSNDSNIVLGGSYGYHPSPLDTNPHTMWEFGLKAKEGLYVMRLYEDECRVTIIEPNVKIICDEQKPGWGLVQAPETIVGYLDNIGINARADYKYIPPAGAAGLVTEPTEYSGEVSSNSISLYANGKFAGTNNCGSPHLIDGKFSEIDDSTKEWENVKFATGKYSHLYADYCDGILYILNDWILANNEPYEKNCYNLFELYTGNGEEHWGIYVYHNPEKKVKVFRNGIDVSNDTTIFINGLHSFDVSPNDTNKHSIYEFGLYAMEGGWNLYFCDPGPSSFCDEDPESAPRLRNYKFGLRSNKLDEPGFHTPILEIDTNHFVLYYGTKELLDSIFFKEFVLSFNYENATIKIDSIQFNEQFSNLNNALAYDINNLQEGGSELIVKSNSNLVGSGDLFAIYFTLDNMEFDNAKLQTTTLLSNLTTNLFKITLPNLNLNNISSISDFPIKTLSYYPNPVYNDILYINLHFNILCDVEIQLFDITANSINLLKAYNEIGYKNYNLNLNKFSSGEYFIKIKANDDVIAFPIIIVR